MLFRRRWKAAILRWDTRIRIFGAVDGRADVLRPASRAMPPSDRCFSSLTRTGVLLMDRAWIRRLLQLTGVTVALARHNQPRPARVRAESGRLRVPPRRGGGATVGIPEL